ncbi:S41 family peptidase [Phocaeicola plebeius]|jgi:peptidase, S41 family|uniref:S41 family peptidase n=2 Tax=Bacteroidaceae TaxID=815 RepID=A0A3E4MSC8_9BACT|nr:S41 family peptidase [Phocaeicola plebeius]HBV19461.1 peptidase S41 [Bacteroides sp.]MBD9354076.1 S41 family peptidase [Phocaeicola plebeius]RGK52262.1 S41 family peptidase [Phocaeicola plebeius]RGM36524.1 S41 family peptidase [Phocaeicola plebeius]
MLGMGMTSFKEDDRNFQISKNLDIFNSIFKELDMFYVDTVNAEKMIQTGVEGMLSLTDPYTEYYPEEEVSSLKEMTTGKYGGIGAAIRYYEAKDRIAVVEPTEGMPAAEAGVKAGDIILSVGGKEMVRGDMKPQEFSSKVSEALRGEPGTSFVLKVLRPLKNDSTVMEFKITRKNIRTNPVPYYGMVKDSIGYLALSSFTENSAKDFKKAFIELKQKGAKSLIIDLRDNGGGSLSEAVDIVNLYVPKGQEIVMTKGKVRQAQGSYKTQNEPVDTQIPLAVLVNGATASASEIVSGSLQDLDRAVVIGSRTFGKGLVQTIRPLPYNGTLKVTTSKYYIPSGRCIQAIDYAKKNADGSVARTPDSLTTVFHTAAGREVRDGGGIRPDIEVKGDKIPNIVFYLMNDDLIFDYATQYCWNHPTLASVDDFKLTDADYEAFKKLVKSRNFTYDRQSEKMLKSLKEIAEFEGYMTEAAEEFKALEKKLNHNLDRDLDYFAKPIKEYISQEIVTRYFYQRGAAMERLKDDTDLEEAIKVLQNPVRYREILSAPVKKDEPVKKEKEETKK